MSNDKDASKPAVPQRDALSAVASDIASMTAEELRAEHESHRNGDIAVALRELSANVAQGVKLSVCYGPMPESNGKTNWTAILHKGDLAEGHTIDRSEYPDRVRYAADCVRYLIGELKERPWILDYDADKHSGYVANVAQGAEAVCRTCNGHGMIGGPSYYAPDEGGEPCPDCAPPAQTAIADDARDAIRELTAAQSASGDTR